MENLDYWRLCDELSVIQAALLIVGEDPANYQEWIDEWKPNDRPSGYDAAKAALTHAIFSGRLTATIRRDARLQGWDEEPSTDEKIRQRFDEVESQFPRGVIYCESPDWQKTTVLVDNLRDWLTSRGIKTGFFFPVKTDAPDYLDSNHPRYAPKLAVAIHAWLALEDGNLTKGKSAKMALDKWIREHAAKFGLTDDEGNAVNLAVEECSKVANWNPGGGAPKTPSA